MVAFLHSNLTNTAQCPPIPRSVENKRISVRICLVFPPVTGALLARSIDAIQYPITLTASLPCFRERDKENLFGRAASITLSIVDIWYLNQIGGVTTFIKQTLLLLSPNKTRIKKLIFKLNCHILLV